MLKEPLITKEPKIIPLPTPSPITPAMICKDSCTTCKSKWCFKL